MSRRRMAALSTSRRMLPASATTVDLVVSSLSNVVITIAIGRGGGAGDLGTYALLTTLAIITVGFSRALVLDPLLSTPGDHRRACNAALTLVVTATTTVAIVGALLFLFVGQIAGVALALGIPLLALQDSLRYVAFARKRPRRALEVDMIWLVASVAAFPLVVATADVLTAILAWIAGGTLAAGVGAYRERFQWVRLTQSIDWWRRDAQSLGRGLAIDGLLYIFSTQLAIYLVAAVTSSNVVGEVRSVQILLMPALFITMGLPLTLIPRLASSGVTRDKIRLISFAAVAAQLPVLITVWAFSGFLFTVVLGGNVEVSELAIAAGVAQALCIGFSVGPTVYLRAARHGGAFPLARGLSGLVGLILVTSLAWQHGSAGALVGSAAQAFLFTLILWITSQRRLIGQYPREVSQ